MKVHHSSFDTNTEEWYHEIIETPFSIGLELACVQLCEENAKSEDDDVPAGPLSFSGDTNRFLLISTWTYGRQWFKRLSIYTLEKLPDDELEALVTVHIDQDAG